MKYWFTETEYRQRQEVKQAAYHRENGACFYCERALKYNQATMDHIKPRSQGGKLGIGNVVLACFPCNNERGDYPAHVYLVLKMTGGL